MDHPTAIKEMTVPIRIGKQLHQPSGNENVAQLPLEWK